VVRICAQPAVQQLFDDGDASLDGRRAEQWPRAREPVRGKVRLHELDRGQERCSEAPAPDLDDDPPPVDEPDTVDAHDARGEELVALD